MNQRNEDLTTGPIIQKLLRFALPLLLGTLVQQLYSTVDLIFVGNVIDKTASAAIGASTLLITCLIGFFGGMAVGAGVVIAQSFGEKDPDRLERAIHSTAALALTGGVCLALLGWLLAPGYLRLIRTPDEIRLSAAAYLRIYFLSPPSSPWGGRSSRSPSRSMCCIRSTRFSGTVCAAWEKRKCPC